MTTKLPPQLIDPTGSTSGQVLTSTGSSTAPSWGNINASSIVGTTTNDSASAGRVGEFVSSTVANTTVSLTSGTPANVTSISLTAGDWDVSGMVIFNTAGTTVMSAQVAGVSSTSATLVTYQFANIAGTQSAGAGGNVVTPVVRISLSATTTVYLVAQGNFTTSTCQAGGVIRARRAR
jgi:hypothetical protein